MPFQLTNSKYTQNLSLSAYYNYLHVTGYDLPYRYISEVGSAGSLNALTYGFSYSRLLRQSKRDVAPRWGQTLSANYRTTPFGGQLTGEQWGIQANLFFPGLAKHHSLRLRAGYQEQARGTYQFSSIVFFPRGQLYVSDDKIRRVVSNTDFLSPIRIGHLAGGCTYNASKPVVFMTPPMVNPLSNYGIQMAGYGDTKRSAIRSRQPASTCRLCSMLCGYALRSRLVSGQFTT